MKKNIKILIVEDEALTAMSLRMELSDEGFIVDEIVATGEKAIISVERHQPDLMLMDIGLAGELDGIEATRIIHSSHKIPVIFFTGYQDETLLKQAHKLNPIDVFIKPVSFLQIKSAIHSAF